MMNNIVESLEIPFSINQLIEKKDFQDIVTTAYFKKITTIAAVILAATIFIVLIIKSLQDGILFSSFPKIEVTMVAIVLVLPFYVKIQAAKEYDSNKRLQKQQTFIFKAEEVEFSCIHYSYRCPWQYFTSSEITKKYLILYSNSNMVEIIKREGLTRKQISFIRDKITSSSMV